MDGCRWSSAGSTTPKRRRRRRRRLRGKPRGHRHERPARPGAGEGDLLRPARRGDRDGAPDRLPPHRGRRRQGAGRARPQDRARDRLGGRGLDDGAGQVAREFDDTPHDFGRIAATTAKQVILQRLRDAEDEVNFGEYAGREGDLVTGVVQQGKDPRASCWSTSASWRPCCRAASRCPARTTRTASGSAAYVVQVDEGHRGP